MGRPKETKYIRAWKKSGKFCLRNWNDPVCLEIRWLLHKLCWNEKKGDRYTYYSEKNSVVIEPRWYADQYYYTIIDNTPTFMWIVTWYKSRGQTDMILFQGTPADEREAKMLLKLLRREAKK